MEAKYNNIFHYNEYTKMWNCFERKDYNAYWNSKGSINVGEGNTTEEACLNLIKKNEV